MKRPKDEDHLEVAFAENESTYGSTIIEKYFILSPPVITVQPVTNSAVGALKRESNVHHITRVQ